MERIESGASEAAGNQLEFSIDPGPYPDLALAVRVRLEEEGARLDQELARLRVKRNGDEIQPSTRKVTRLSLPGRRQPNLQSLHIPTSSGTRTAHRRSVQTNTHDSRLICFKTLTEDRSINEKQILLAAITPKQVVGRQTAPSLALLRHKKEDTRRRFGERRQQADIAKAARKASTASSSLGTPQDILNLSTIAPEDLDIDKYIAAQKPLRMAESVARQRLRERLENKESGLAGLVGQRPLH